MNEKNELEKIGAAIRYFRNKLGISQENFADQIGMHRAYYGAIERGKKNITISTLMRVCSGLDVSIYELFDRINFQERVD